MTTLTIRIPDDTAARLREMAKHRGISLNKLMEEFSATGLAEFDTETRFRLRAAGAASFHCGSTPWTICCRFGDAPTGAASPR